MKDKSRFQLSAAAVAITAAAAVTAAAAAAVGIVLHKISKLNALFELENRGSPIDFAEDVLLEVEGVDAEEN